jgi:DNA-binding beta-propeller fold protein YncE
MMVQLVGASVGFDDLAYAADLGRVVAAPESTGKLFLIDPDSLAITTVDVPRGVASADARGGFAFGADRLNQQIVVVDLAANQIASMAALGAGPDYVRASPTTDEVWVTLPGDGRIDIYARTGAQLAKAGSVAIGDPEGLSFDGRGKAYTNDGGDVVQIDVATRAVTGRWSDGCGGSHGFPQSDPDRQLAFGGCSSNGGVGVVDFAGDNVAGFEAGGGLAILAYAPALHHLYVRGDPGATLDILGACSNGALAKLASVPIPDRGHGAIADDRGHVWVCDSFGGGVIRIADPAPQTP